MLVLLPVKRLAGAKIRLAGLLSQEERSALALVMLGDVLAAVRAAGLTPSVLSPDLEVLGFAESAGAAPVRQHAGIRTLNEALTRALADVRGPSGAALVLLPDTPLATSEDLRLLTAGRTTEDEPRIAIATDRVGRGTNALFLTPPTAIPLSFGRGSLARHLRSAAGSGVRAVIQEHPSLAFDIDTPADVRDLMEAPGDTQTQRLLRRLRAGERLS